jgi:hypothetical protein
LGESPSYKEQEDLAMSTVTFTSEEVCAIHYWPFPCEEGAIIDPESTLHGAGFTFVFVDRSGGATAVANRSGSVDERLLWVAQATGATISRAVAVQQSADTLEGAGDSVIAANRSAIGKFVDGLVASPPVCDVIPVRPGPFVLGGGAVIIIVIPPPPPQPPPEWGPGEQLSRIDLISIGTRFQAAAAALKAGPLREEFFAAQARLFEVGAERS